MKALFQTLKPILNARTHFYPEFIMLKCPHFLVKAIMGKTNTETRETKPWWYNYPEVYTRQSENNTIEYEPRYEC
jgi:hypothetical protein